MTDTTREAPAASPEGTPTTRPGLAAYGGWLLATVSLGLVFFVHRGLGPEFAVVQEPFATAGFLRGKTPPQAGPTVLLYGGIAAALAVGVFLTTRSAVARFLSVASLAGVALFAVFAAGNAQAWNFFGWRWSGSIAGFASIAGAALCAPLLAHALRAQALPVRFLLYGSVFLAVLIVERDLTGTDPNLPLALSPWPVLQVFGLEVVATFIAALWVGVGLGLLLLARRPPIWLRGPLALLVAAGLPLATVRIGSWVGLLPFEVGGGSFVASAALGTLVLGLSLARPGAPDPGSPGLEARGMRCLFGGVLLALPLLVGQSLARLDYATTRDDRAAAVIDGLQAWIDREGTYPETLEEMVEAGDLPSAPRTRIGFGVLSDRAFTYQNFGTDYLLEFSAPRWTQCAYNPPWTAALSEEERAELEPEDLAEVGAWSCPQRPPELW